MIFSRKKKESPQEEKTFFKRFSTDERGEVPKFLDIGQIVNSLAKAKNDVSSSIPQMAIDSCEFPSSRSNGFGDIFPHAQAAWYVSQTFIGYQMCTIMSQQWLIDKCCTMPARDAVKGGYTLHGKSGVAVSPAVLSEIEDLDRKYKIIDNLVQFERLGRVYGVRHALFKVESSDPDYYAKPFNIDGVKPGSYKGIVQIDPIWMSPELSLHGASDPTSDEFYEPTWWIVNGKRIHKSHFVIMKTCELPDILKPTYRYGGVPIPQLIYERVYASERTANEAPMLSLTKRTDIYKTDLSEASSDPGRFERNMQHFVRNRDNYGVKLIDMDEEMSRIDTALSDLDAVIMTQYQLVCSAARVPSTKLLGTAPKGFNATGEYEESSYHEELHSIQTHDMTPLLERHYELMIRSDVSPMRPELKDLVLEICWAALDSPTEFEWADINLKKAQTAATLAQTGAINGDDERRRLASDENSGYAGLEIVDEEEANSEIEELTNIYNEVNQEEEA